MKRFIVNKTEACLSGVEKKELDLYPSKPDWLADEVIAKLRNDIAICPSSYTQEEVDELEFDAPFDLKKHNAFMVIKILKLFNIPY